jgi:FO synthase
VKLGADGVRYCLSAGVNDLGGTLMDESISRAAGAAHGQEMTPQRMEEIIASCGRQPLQRTTLYRHADQSRRDQSFRAAPKRSSPTKLTLGAHGGGGSLGGGNAGESRAIV